MTIGLFVKLFSAFPQKRIVVVYNAGAAYGLKMTRVYCSSKTVPSIGKPKRYVFGFWYVSDTPRLLGRGLVASPCAIETHTPNMNSSARTMIAYAEILVPIECFIVLSYTTTGALSSEFFCRVHLHALRHVEHRNVPRPCVSASLDFSPKA